MVHDLAKVRETAVVVEAVFLVAPESGERRVLSNVWSNPGAFFLPCRQRDSGEIPMRIRSRYLAARLGLPELHK